MRTFFIVTTLLATLSAASAGYVDTPQCRRDLAATEASFSAKLRDLERTKSSAVAQRRPSFGRHGEVMRKASSVFRQCSTGRGLQENVGQMDGSIPDFQEIIARHCR